MTDDRLTVRERRFLAIINPTGTIAQETTAGLDLELRGFVAPAPGNRYRITPAGIAAIEQYPESDWQLPQEPARREGRR